MLAVIMLSSKLPLVVQGGKLLGCMSEVLEFACSLALVICLPAIVGLSLLFSADVVFAAASLKKGYYFEQEL